MHRKLWRVASTTVAAGALAFSMVGFAPTASPATVAGSPGQDASHPSTLQQALAAESHREGLSPEELGGRMEEQNEFALAVTGVRQEYSDTFSWGNIDGNDWTVAFKGAVPAEVSKKFADLPRPVVLVGNVGWSAKEFSNAVESVHYSLYRGLGDEQGIATSSDIHAGTIAVTVPHEQRAQAESVLRGLHTDPRFSVSVNGTTQPTSGEDAKVYGGGNLTSCTAGWSVKDNSHPNGLITAAHCSNSQAFLSGSIALTFIAQSTARDVQWHSSGSVTAKPEFYNGSSVTTHVNSFGYPQIGQTLCKIGKTTGGTCDVV